MTKTIYVCTSCSAFKGNVVFIDTTFNEHFEQEHNCVFTRDCWRHLADFNSPFGREQLDKALLKAKLREMKNW